MKIYTLYLLSNRHKQREIEEVLPTIATFLYTILCINYPITKFVQKI